MIRRRDRQQMLPGTIPQAADLDPQAGIVRRDRQDAVVSPGCGGQVVVQLFELGEHTKAFSRGAWREDARTKPLARMAAIVLADESRTHEGGDLVAGHAGFQCRAQLHLGINAVVAAQRGACRLDQRGARLHLRLSMPGKRRRDQRH